MPQSKTPSKSPVFYGWYILTASFFILFLYTGARYAIGVAFKPMIAEFGWNRSAISLVIFLNMTCYALALPFMGRFYDRYGPKWVLIISTLFLFMGCGSLAFINSFWQFLISYGIIFGVGLGGPSSVLFASIATKWFQKARGLAVSLGLSGACLGQFAVVPIFTILVLNYGWRVSYFLIGLSMLVVNIPLAIWILKGDPEALGKKPYGYKNGGGTEESRAKPGYVDSSQDLGLRDAMRTRSFWFFVVSMFICGSGDFMVTTHLIPLVTDQGISPTTAGNMLAWFGLMSLLGIMVAGPASDLIGNKIPIALTFVMRILLFLMVIKVQNYLSFYIFALAFGFTFFITAALVPIMNGRLFGFSHVGVLSGFVTTAHHFGGGLWIYVGGWLFDRTGSYQEVFKLSLIAAFIALICTFLVKEKRHLIRPLKMPKV